MSFDVLKTLPSSAFRPVAAAAVLVFALPAPAQEKQPTPAVAVGSVATAAPAAPDYAARLQKLLDETRPGGTVGLYVVDGATSEVLFSMNGEEPLKPASNNKLLTTAAGLSLLGPDYRFVTSILVRGTVLNGTLQGDLIVRGGGDPTISGRFEENKRDVTAIFRRWSDALAAAGIRRITGDVVADDTFFDSEEFHPFWYGDERGEWYSAEISGLAFNDNCVDLTWSAVNKVPGDLADFRMNPVTSYVQIQNAVRVMARGRVTERYYKRPAKLNDILCTGSLTVDTVKEDSAAVHDGALYAVTVFRDVLTSQGIEVLGRARKLDERFDTSAPLTLVFEHRSPPLTEVVNVINRNSQNFYAECLLKTLGRVVLNEGSFQAGSRVVQHFVKTRGLFCEGHQMVDGSGLSARNRVSPRQLVEVIRMMDQGPHKEAWRASLPVGGVSGTLRARFNENDEARSLAPRIMAKTGYIGGVRSLSGIVERPEKSPLYFSIVLNGYRIGNSRTLDLIDKLALALARD